MAVASGSTILVALVTYRAANGEAIVSVKWNTSETFTFVRHDVLATSGTHHSEIWYLLAPTSGTHNIDIDFGAAPTVLSASVVSLFGTATSSPVDAHNGTSGTGDLSQTIATTQAGSWVLDVFGIRSNAGTITAGTQTGRTAYSPVWDDESLLNKGCGGGTKFENAAAATYTCDWTQTNAVHSALSIVAIKTPPAAGRTSKNTRASNLGMELGMKLWMPD